MTRLDILSDCRFCDYVQVWCPWRPKCHQVNKDEKYCSFEGLFASIRMISSKGLGTASSPLWHRLWNCPVLVWPSNYQLSQSQGHSPLSIIIGIQKIIANSESCYLIHKLWHISFLIYCICFIVKLSGKQYFGPISFYKDLQSPNLSTIMKYYFLMHYYLKTCCIFFKSQ